MSNLPFLTWVLVPAALILGILAGHFGWGRRWPAPRAKLHPDYLAGLDFLVTEQPDRALDIFLKLMSANADTVETLFALGSLYRRRGEVERAIRIHENLLARESLAPEHREQALLALAQDYLRAGLLDRAEGLFQQVSAVPRLKVSALEALRGVYEQQADWQQALEVYRQLAGIQAAPPPTVAAHYLCELAALAMERGDTKNARLLLRDARHEARPFARAALLRSQIAEREGNPALALRLLREAVGASPPLMQVELPHLIRLVGAKRRDALLRELVAEAQRRDFTDLKRLVFAAIGADLGGAEPLRASIATVFSQDPTLRAGWRAGSAQAGSAQYDVMAQEVGALLAQAEKYRCRECGFSAHTFYWHCPACHAWEGFEAYAVVKLG